MGPKSEVLASVSGMVNFAQYKAAIDLTRERFVVIKLL
jgi:hypothetical protein